MEYLRENVILVYDFEIWTILRLVPIITNLTVSCAPPPCKYYGLKLPSPFSPLRVAHGTPCIPRNMRFSQSVKEFSLEKPAYNSFNAPLGSRIFVGLFVVISVFVFLAVEAGNGYESIAVFSPNFTQTSLLWYEHFGPWLHIAPSWTCQSSVIQRGQGLIPAILF